MNKKTKWVAMCMSVLLGAVAAPALAQQGGDRGLYVGGSVGMSSARDSGEATTWGGFAGWQFTRNVAFEAGARDLGRFLNLGRDVDAAVVEAVLVAGVPLGPLFVYGKGGLYRGETSIGPQSDSNVNWTFGGGAQYDLTQRVALRIESQYYRDIGGSPINFRANAYTVSGGVVLKFR